MSLIFYNKKEKPFLYLGSQTFAKNQTFLQKLGVTHIVNATTEVENYFPQSITYLKLKIEDNEFCDIEKCFGTSHQFIQEVFEYGGVVLVHSFAGISRSVTIVISYLMKCQKMTLRQAFDSVKKSRKEMQPNETFFKILLEYEKKLYGKTTMKLSEIQ
eukprot:gene1339-11421_t